MEERDFADEMAYEQSTDAGGKRESHMYQAEEMPRVRAWKYEGRG